MTLETQVKLATYLGYLTLAVIGATVIRIYLQGGGNGGNGGPDMPIEPTPTPDMAIV